MGHKHLADVIFVVKMVFSAVFWRNMFVLEGGVSEHQSPSETILNRPLDMAEHTLQS